MTPVKNSCNRRASEPWSQQGGWVVRLHVRVSPPPSAAFHLQPWASLLSSLPPSVLPTPLPFPAPWFPCCSSPLTSLVLVQSSYTGTAHMSLFFGLQSAVTLPVWWCQITASFYSLSPSVCHCLCVLLCLLLCEEGDRCENTKIREVSPFWKVEMMAIIAAGGPIITSVCHLSLSWRQDFKV